MASAVQNIWNKVVHPNAAAKAAEAAREKQHARQAYQTAQGFVSRQLGSNGLGAILSKSKSGDIYVSRIKEGSPLAKAGVTEGTFITAVNGAAINGNESILFDYIGRAKGGALNLAVKKGNEPERVISVKGLELDGSPYYLGAGAEVMMKDGNLVITKIASLGPAEEMELRPGDTVVGINTPKGLYRFSNEWDFYSRMSAMKPGNAKVLCIQRNGGGHGSEFFKAGLTNLSGLESEPVEPRSALPTGELRVTKATGSAAAAGFKKGDIIRQVGGYVRGTVPGYKMFDVERAKPRYPFTFNLPLSIPEPGTLYW